MSASGGPRRAARRAWVPRFLEMLRATSNVRLAADAAGVDRTTPYHLAQRNPAFAAAWAAAEQDATDVLEGEARRRALAGSDALLMFLLKAHRPERYRETLDVHVEVRREAARMAARLGCTVEEVLAAAERKAKEVLGP
jgi:hypothetical protein